MEKRADKLLKKCKLAGYYLVHVAIGCCIIGVLYILTLIGLFWFLAHDAESGNPIFSDLGAYILVGIGVFIIPFSLGAIYFRSVFRSWNHRALIITTALLFGWFCEKLANGSGIYHIDIWNLPQLLFRISKGEDQSVPWFAIKYALLTMLGCIVLGFIASKGKKEPLNQTGQL